LWFCLTDVASVGQALAGERDKAQKAATQGAVDCERIASLTAALAEEKKGSAQAGKEAAAERERLLRESTQLTAKYDRYVC
jgi:hypothetical protein